MIKEAISSLEKARERLLRMVSHTIDRKEVNEVFDELIGKKNVD